MVLDSWFQSSLHPTYSVSFPTSSHSNNFLSFSLFSSTTVPLPTTQQPSTQLSHIIKPSLTLYFLYKHGSALFLLESIYFMALTNNIFQNWTAAWKIQKMFSWAAKPKLLDPTIFQILQGYWCKFLLCLQYRHAKMCLSHQLCVLYTQMSAALLLWHH